MKNLLTISKGLIYTQDFKIAQSNAYLTHEKPQNVCLIK